MLKQQDMLGVKKKSYRYITLISLMQFVFTYKRNKVYLARFSLFHCFF